MVGDDDDDGEADVGQSVPIEGFGGVEGSVGIAGGARCIRRWLTETRRGLSRRCVQPTLSCSCRRHWAVRDCHCGKCASSCVWLAFVRMLDWMKT